jgi:hypothetical protein
MYRRSGLESDSALYPNRNQFVSFLRGDGIHPVCVNKQGKIVSPKTNQLRRTVSNVP